MTGSDERTEDRPLKGCALWIISDGKQGHEAQSLGVAEALGARVTWKRVSPKGLWRWLAPWGPVAPSERFGTPASQFAPPWPDIAIAAGRTTTPYLRKLRSLAKFRTFTVVLMDPGTPPNTADLFWVPEHDRRRGPNVFTTVTAPHAYSQGRLADLKAALPADIEALPRPRAAVLLGGPNDVFSYDDAALQRLRETVRGFCAEGQSLMITPSRRTPKALLDAIEEDTRGAPRVLWRGEGENPYGHFLAAADAFLITGDSVNMLGEASATGKPIYAFRPTGGSDKFTRLHERLSSLGVIRLIDAPPPRFETWSYRPLSSADAIAREIERRWSKRKALVPGLVT